MRLPALLQTGGGLYRPEPGEDPGLVRMHLCAEHYDKVMRMRERIKRERLDAQGVRAVAGLYKRICQARQADYATLQSPLPYLLPVGRIPEERLRRDLSGVAVAGGDNRDIIEAVDRYVLVVRDRSGQRPDFLTLVGSS